ncbi:unnamed protein product [Cuscuta epithymum]|uniref:30S ribosomal protein S31, chloroplastic n=1 Tax=Cuscuta epithymum TaxID=186058 RepID=A0AAV0GHS4_9ASTE|nr:unnamed protein product [Cuscuta epithymum]CAH9147474.1 unnamed protein product [Cuscuta epithymum]
MALLLAGAVPIVALTPPLSSSHAVSSLPVKSSSSLSFSVTCPSLPLIYCGRGDKKTARGKRFNHSFGNARPKDKRKGRGPPRVSIPPSAPKKDPFDDVEVVDIEIDESIR